MAFTDHNAASKITALREEQGLNSAEALASAIKLAATGGVSWAERGTVDAWTIRMIEKGHVPGPRIRFVLASYFDVTVAEIWEPKNFRPIPISIATAAKRAVPA